MTISVEYCVSHVNPIIEIGTKVWEVPRAQTLPSAPTSVLGYGFSTTFPVVAPVSRSRWASAASASGIANTVGVRT
jgi:hypothetical protein